ncbi:MAG: polysaccharide biosynthesis C-terminal domain-containing protein [Chloroflexi bacterium]|nr:polysaccharide biosynthesis C-terminal domain-containing protein [Chloroflexota bacterium]MCC6891665.1 lipopolysaccharide biosynthesis protein [Anaerolineae bacterium]
MRKLYFDRKSLSYKQLVEHLRTPLYRNGYALILSTGITSALGLLYWAVAAKFYQTEDVGLNSAVISIMIFLSSMSQLNLQETMIRYIPVAGRRTPRFVVMTYSVVIGLSALVGLVFFLGIPIWSPTLTFLTASPALAGWFIATVAIWGVFVLQDSVLVGLRQALWIPAENAVFSVIKVAMLVLLAAILPQTGIFVSWTVSVLIIIIPINILLFKRLIPKHIETTTQENLAIPLRQLTKYVAGNYAAALFANMASTLLPLIITQVAGAEANAHFYLAWTIASSLQIAVSNMATSLTVEAIVDSKNIGASRRKAMVGILRLVLPAAALLIVAAPVILRFVGPSYVEEGVPLMQLLALSAIPNVYNAVYISMARANNRIRGIVGVYGANAVMVLGLSHIFLPEHGIVGVGLAWAISQTVIMVVLMLLARFQKPVPTPAVVVAE